MTAGDLGNTFERIMEEKRASLEPVDPVPVQQSAKCGFVIDGQPCNHDEAWHRLDGTDRNYINGVWHSFQPAYLPVAPSQSVEAGYVCQECGKPYWSWFTDDLFWNLVMTPDGQPVIDDPGGLLCVECFIARAEKVYAVAGWKVIPTFGYPRVDGGPM